VSHFGESCAAPATVMSENGSTTAKLLLVRNRGKGAVQVAAESIEQDTHSKPGDRPDIHITVAVGGMV